MSKLEQNHNKREEQNEYAYNLKEEVVYIEDAESGKKGYYCIGCGAEMQAVKPKKQGIRSYFRHDATDVKKNPKPCVFSNKDFRHSQAIDILNRIKRIKLPPLYKKAPSENSEQKALKIRDSRFLEAHYTRKEVSFYENSIGEIKSGKLDKNDPNTEKNLLIRPDVTFYNAKDEPILFIEIVVSHKITPEKLARIKRLGIDTVQITIPKDSLENIEKSFLEGKRIKWIHSNEREKAHYIFVSENNSKGVLQIDEFEKGLLEETFECRRAQVSNLIRSIRKSLESEQYRSIEQRLRSELLRVEGNTRAFEEQLEEVRTGIRAELEKKYSVQTREIERRIEGTRESRKTVSDDFNREEDSIRSRRSDLEKRYTDKRSEIERGLIEVRNLERAEERIRRETERTKELIDSTRESIERERKVRGRIPEKYHTIEVADQQNFDKEIERIDSARNSLPEKFERDRRELEQRFEDLRKQRIGQIESEDSSGSSEFSRILKKILNTRSLLDDFDETRATYTRYREMLKYFREGNFKK